MTKLASIVFLSFLLVACDVAKKTNTSQPSTSFESRVFFRSLSDTLSISVHLPENYAKQPEAHYPVVFLLDANLYFDIMASIVKKYSAVGLGPEVILVGVGYKDFAAMDSLRTRDYTYPVAIPEYEMSTSGGGLRFLSALTKEVIPYINSKYRTLPSRQILAGHSLAGYFTAFALLQQMSGAHSAFYGYIAASPSFHYNKYYLLDQFENVGVERSIPARVYFTFGGLEDNESQIDSSLLSQRVVSQRLLSRLGAKESGLIYKSEIFSNLDHMDTQLPTFIKGLQWTLKEE